MCLHFLKHAENTYNKWKKWLQRDTNMLNGAVESIRVMEGTKILVKELMDRKTHEIMIINLK